MSRQWTASQEAAMSIRGKTLLVSAAAGSGKTSVLTERIIRSLTDREHPADLSRLLVVTFTRAAAAELKARIAAALTEALAEDPQNKHLSGQLLMLGSAQISTIDSFFQKIVRANFEQLGLPATFRIADEAEIIPLSDEIMGELLEEFYRRYAPENTSSSLFGIEQNRFAQAMDHLLSNRSNGKLISALCDFYDLFSSYPEGIKILHACADELTADAEREFMKTKYGRALSDYLRDLLTGYLAELTDIQRALSAEPDSYAKCSGILCTDIDYCNAMLKALGEDCYDRLRCVANSFIAGRFPVIKEKSAAVIRYRDIRAAFRKDISGKVQEKLSWSDDHVHLHMRKTASLCYILHEFFSAYESRMMAEKQQRSILEYNDVRAMLYRLLSRDGDEASAFADALAAQYDAVYIDEYQDVDQLQDRIFSMIGRDRRFMVGDIKQSIYGFRGSDPSIFSAYRRAMPLHTDREADGKNGLCVFMSENFRCNLPVIEFANCICSFLFSACEDSVGYRPEDDLICSKRPSDNEPSPVQVAVFDAPPRGVKAENEEQGEEDGDGASNEAVWVAAEISRLCREERLDNGEVITPSDIAILVRAKKHGEAFEKELRALNIPVTAELARDFLHEPLMTDLLNLLRSIDNPYRDIPLSEFLISPFGGYTLEELTEIRGAAPMAKALYDALTSAASSSLSTAPKAKRTIEWLDKLREDASLLPADRFLRLLYLDEVLLPFSSDPVFLFLYEQARVYQKSSWCGLYDFLCHMEKRLESSPVSANGFCKAESAVSIMTVHHSKGLEYPVVFLSGCGAAFNRSDMQENLMYHRRAGVASKLYYAETGENENTILREIVKQEIDLEQSEESIRTLYVALTRARERLYVTATLRGKWDNALSSASIVRYGNRTSILSCNSYLAWILAAREHMCLNNREFPCIFQHFSSDRVQKGLPVTGEEKAERARIATVGESSLAGHYAAVCRENATFSYPLAHLRGLPTKAAASKLCVNLLDILQDEESEEEALRTQIELMSACPNFENLLADRKKASATEIGSATHAFLEFCDFENLRRYGIDEELARLIEKKFLSKESADMILREQLELLLKSNLMEWVGQATEILREQTFRRFVPFSTLTEDPDRARMLRGHELLVQGSIDLLLRMPDGSLYLVDYKTDRILPEEKKDPARFAKRMRERHGAQLFHYREAVKELFGQSPKKAFIYSLPFGRAFEIEE